MGAPQGGGDDESIGMLELSYFAAGMILFRERGKQEEANTKTNCGWQQTAVGLTNGEAR